MFVEEVISDVADTPHVEEPEVTATSAVPLSEMPTLQTVANAYVNTVLEKANGNKSQAAKVLGIDRRTLYRILARQKAGASVGSGF